VQADPDVTVEMKAGRKRLYALADEHVRTLLHAAFGHVGAT